MSKALLFAGLVASGIYLLVGFTKLWFTLDEWDFLARRGIRIANQGIFYPHNEHWSTIPIIVWRAIFSLVGVRDYWLYAVPLVAAHLGTVYLLWRFMLRHKVEMWTAALLAVAFAFVGVGAENLTWAFQLGFVASAAFGLLAIDAIETDRVWLAPLWGICALMCSDMGIPMVIACGFVALVERKVREAAIAVLPPAVVFVVWYAAIGHQGTASDPTLGSVHFAGLPRFAWTGLTAAIGGFLDVPHLVGVVAVVLLGVIAVVYRNAPAALAAAAVPFYAFIGLGRLDLGANQAATSRYSYLAIAFVLPLIGCFLTRLEEIRYLRPAVMVVLGLLVVVNVVVLHRQEQNRQKYVAATDGQTQIGVAAFLLNRGNVYPGQFAANSQCAVLPNAECVAQDVPTLAALATLVHKGQLPVPTRVGAGELQAEESVLNVSVSADPKVHQSVSPTAPNLCERLGAGVTLTVGSSSEDSLHIYVSPQDHPAIATVSFPGLDERQSASTLVPLPTGASWLNLPAAHNGAATIESTKPIRVCQYERLN